MKDRKARTEKPTSDEIFKMKSKMLDEQIAMNGKMKKILSPEQFQKWDEMKKHHREGMRKNKGIRNHGSQGMKKDMRHKENSEK